VSRSSLRQERSDHKQSGESTLREVVVAMIILVLASTSVFIVASRRSPERFAAPFPSRSTTEGLPVRGRMLGRPDAPVAIVEYGDFQCPACRMSAQTILAALKAEYIRVGVVRYQYQPVAFLGPASLRAAEAALCAEEQGQFWPYHDQLRAFPAGESGEIFSPVSLKRLAVALGLDRPRFNACLDQGRRREDALRMTQEARARGVSRTPTFLINGMMVVGAVSYTQIKQAVERAK